MFRVVSSVCLPTICGPPVGDVIVSVANPLAQIDFAQDDCTSCTKFDFGGDCRITWDFSSMESERPGYHSVRMLQYMICELVKSLHIPVLFISSSVTMLFLIRMGMPCRGLVQH